MRILVFGAGPLGSLIASRLHEAGQDVYLLARGQRLQDLTRHGVVIKEEGTDAFEISYPKIVESFGPDDEYDLVMIVMRKNQADASLDLLAQNKNVPTFLFMGNNAAGPENLIRALGADRVMLGFPLPGGERDGHIMRVMPVNEKRTYPLPLGEVDGTVRKRTHEIAAVLHSMRGYRAQIRRDMPAWLMYHVALLMPGFVPALYGANNQMKRLGQTPDLLVLAVRATKEALRGLRRSGIPTSPSVVRVLEYVPEPLFVGLVGFIMRKEWGKASVEGHPRDARDEMLYLFNELMDTMDRTKTKTEAIDELRKYYDPDTMPLPAGRRNIGLNWASLAAPAAVFLLLVMWKRRKHQD